MLKIYICTFASITYCSITTIIYGNRTSGYTKTLKQKKRKMRRTTTEVAVIQSKSIMPLLFIKFMAEFTFHVYITLTVYIYSFP